MHQGCACQYFFCREGEHDPAYIAYFTFCCVETERNHEMLFSCPAPASMTIAISNKRPLVAAASDSVTLPDPNQMRPLTAICKRDPATVACSSSGQTSNATVAPAAMIVLPCILQYIRPIAQLLLMRTV